jgi:STAS domain
MDVREAAGIVELQAMIDTQTGQCDLARLSLQLAGEFDAYDWESLRQILDVLLSSRETVCVDLSRVTFLDLRCARELAIRSHVFYGDRLTLYNPSWQAISSFRACGYEPRSLFPRPISTLGIRPG